MEVVQAGKCGRWRGSPEGKNGTYLSGAFIFEPSVATQSGRGEAEELENR
jgi:hypothetical protein